MRVGILPTGDTELQGLPSALAACFPGHEFYPIARRRRPSGQLEPHPGFTSARVSAEASTKKSDLTRLVAAMASHIEPGRDNDPPDLLIVVDDLELANLDQPQVVVEALRRATRAHLEDLAARHNARFVDRLRAALRERVSFHIVAPMIEAWLFADPAGPIHAGVPSEHLPPRLVPGSDPEAFKAADPDFEADDGHACSPWTSKHKRPPWIRERRSEHPKAYLSWLCRDPEAKKCTRYTETCRPGEACGATALAKLDWAEALADPEHCRFMRALIEDLADALDRLDTPHPGETSALTSRFVLPPDPILRNV